MTTEAFDEVDPYVISGTGPYAIGHAYADGAIVAQVELSDGTLVALSAGIDFSVLPLSGISGDLTLSASAATTYDGETLLIRRRTPVEQGFAGQTAREVGLEANIDQLAMALQEVEKQAYRSIRVDTGEISPFTPQDGAMPLWDAAGNRFVNGPVSDEISNAQAYAVEAKAWARTAEDTEVQPGEFSALHWAAKSAASAAEAATFDPANFYTKVQADAQFLTPAAGDNAYLGQVPVGTVLPFAGGSAPTGFLKLNGATISRTTYAALFTHLDALGLAGPGDGSTTFDLPDARGYGLRFWDDGRGKDSGRALGSFQEDALQQMTGTINNVVATSGGVTATGVFSYPFNAGFTLGVGSTNLQTRTIDFSANRDARTASETRMANFALLAVIKY